MEDCVEISRLDRARDDLRERLDKSAGCVSDGSDTDAARDVVREAVRDAACRAPAARMDDRRLSLRLSSWCASRMAVSMEPELAKCSAVSSRWATLLQRVERVALRDGLLCGDEGCAKAGSCCCSGEEGGRVALGCTIVVVIKVGAGRRAGDAKDRDRLAVLLAMDRLELTRRMRSLVITWDWDQGSVVVAERERAGLSLGKLSILPCTGASRVSA